MFIGFSGADLAVVYRCRSCKYSVWTTLEHSGTRADWLRRQLAGGVPSRFDDAVRARVRERYVDAIAGWRDGEGYRMPGEFVVAAARVPA
jgi:hypothetical protein